MTRLAPGLQCASPKAETVISRNRSFKEWQVPASDGGTAR